MKKIGILLVLLIIATAILFSGCLQKTESASVTPEVTPQSTSEVQVGDYPEKPEDVVKKYYIGLWNKKDPEVFYRYFTKECIKEMDKEAKEEGYENIRDEWETLFKRAPDSFFIEDIVITDVKIAEKEDLEKEQTVLTPVNTENRTIKELIEMTERRINMFKTAGVNTVELEALLLEAKTLINRSDQDGARRILDEYYNPITTDSDGDGWADEFELQEGTDPHNPDTDGDEIIDPKDFNPLVPDFPGERAWVDINIYFSEEDPRTGERSKETQTIELVRENGKWKIEC